MVSPRSRKPLIIVLVLALCARAHARESYFYHKFSQEELGTLDYDAATGNPLKGLVANPDFYYDPTVESIDSSMDIWYFGLDSVMMDDPDKVGREAAFDWSELETRLDKSTARGRHAILTFHVHYPGFPLRLPKHIKESDIPLHWYSDVNGGGLTPHYGTPLLLNAMVQFVRELGRLYDGDKRVAFIHTGLLGFWHTFPRMDLVPDHAKEQITNAFLTSFSDTKIQGRYPGDFSDNTKIGLYDGSFAYTTLDGEHDGGEQTHWYFWPMVEDLGRSDFWRTGETRPELQKEIFEPEYQAGTHKRQDFMECVEKTHSTYMFHSDAFIEGGYSGHELDAAFYAHNRLGYSFLVSGVDVAAVVVKHLVDIDVTVEQVGVAPFYYPLHLSLSCQGVDFVLPGVDSLIAAGDKRTFTFRDVPKTKDCLDSISISLVSPMQPPGRPIKFSQGNGFVKLSIPFVWDVNKDLMNTEGWGELARLTLVKETAYGQQESGSLHDGDVIVASALKVRADADDAVAAVLFSSVSIYAADFSRPFGLEKDEDNSRLLNEPGWKSLTVTVFDFRGAAVGERTISFEVVSSTRKRVLSRSLFVKVQAVSSHDGLAPSVTERAPLELLHGFNTPRTPTLLQIGALEAEIKRGATYHATASGTTVTKTQALIGLVLVGCLVLIG